MILNWLSWLKQFDNKPKQPSVNSMSRYHGYDNYYEDDYQPRPSTKIYALRREGRIDEARQMAEELIRNKEADSDVWKAYAWTMIDICKRCLDSGESDTARSIADYLVNLSMKKFEPEASLDEFAETLAKRIKALSLTANPFYAQIQEAKDLSQNGNNDRAWEILSQLSSNGNLPVVAHESYGWVLYKYLRDHYKALSSEQVRGLLRDYMVLTNERPSALHSQILNFALNYSKEDASFKLVAFLKLWGPDNLRDDDYYNSMGKDGKMIPSLMSRIARAVIDYSASDIQEFVGMLGDNQNTFIEMLKEQFFWKIYHSTEGNVSASTWKLFEQYLDFYPEAPASVSHSKVLSLAERVMKDNDVFRFYGFFKKWNPEKLRKEDWQEETGENGETYKPLAIKSIKKAKESLSALSEEQVGDLQWLVDLYGVAVSKFPDDDWIIRSKAIILLHAGQLEEAKAIYKDLCLKMGEKYYIWQEFSNCWVDTDTKIALLCKAISLEKNEDFIGKIRLELARQLILAGRPDNALVEINLYKKHYTQMGWRISAEVKYLQTQCSISGPVGSDNDALYHEFIPKAEEFAFADIPYTEVVLVDKWKNEDGKSLMAFTDGDSVDFVINKKRFSILRDAHKGQVWKMKLYKEETVKTTPSPNRWIPSKKEVTVKYIPLIINQSDKRDWESLPLGYGYVQYVNVEKKVYHIYSTDSILVFEHYDHQVLSTGDYVSFRRYKKKVKDENKTFFCNVCKSSEEEAISKFKSRIVAVDDVNENKQLFHFVLGPRLISGILHYDQTDLRPSVGDCIRIHYFVRKINDKKNPGHQKKVIEVLKSEETNEGNSDVVRSFSGYLDLKYKSGSEEGAPDYAFVEGYYVPKYLLDELYIKDEYTTVHGRAVYSGEDPISHKSKWKVFEIEEYD